MRFSHYEIFFLSFLLMLFMTVFGYSQQPNFVYVNNDTSPNSISAFSVSPTGALTQVPGSPFMTGGNGTNGNQFLAVPQSDVVTMGNFLYVGNAESSTINAGSVSGFTINSTTGVLTLIPGSPFVTGGNTSIGVSLTATPNGKFLFAGNSDGTVTTFSVGTNGVLTQVAGSPFNFGAVSVDGSRTSPDGKFLAIADPFAANIFILSIGANGSLTLVGSPVSSNVPTSVDFSADGKFLYVGTVFNSVEGYNFAVNGTITAIPGSPFTGGGGSLQSIRVTQDSKFLYASDTGGSISAFNIAANGVLSLVPGSPFPANLFTTISVTNMQGNLLYVANLQNNSINVYSIAANGALSQVAGSPFSVPGNSSSVAAFPPAPRGVANPLLHNTVYAADTANNRIQRSTDQGMTWNAVGFGAGTGAGFFNAPKAVSSDSTDMKIFVADTANNRIQRSTNGGLTWQIIATSGLAPSQVNSPQGLAYDEPSDTLYIADTLNNRILRVSSASGIVGFSVFAGSTAGIGLGQFSQPRAVAVNSAGQVYVADTANNRIQMNTTGMTGGWVIFAGATAGTALGKFSSPRAIFVDDTNKVYIADTANNRIQVNTGGTMGGWSLFASAGTTLGFVNAPEGIVLNSARNIFIGDTGNNRIQRKPEAGGATVLVGPSGIAIGQFNRVSQLR